MEKKLNGFNNREYENYQSAVRSLEKASKIAMKLGIYPGEIKKMKEKEIEELQQFFLKR